MKLFPIQLGLRLKLTLPVVFLILVIMFSISFLFGLRHEQTLRSEMKRRAVRIAQTAGTMSLIPLPGVPAWTLSKSFVPLVPQLDPNVLYIVVFDELGKVQAASINQSLLKELLKQEEIASAEKELISEVTDARGIKEERSGPSRWGSLLPVEVGLQPDGRGKVVVGFSLEEMEREVSSSRRTALGLTLGFVVLGGWWRWRSPRRLHSRSRCWFAGWRKFARGTSRRMLKSRIKMRSARWPTHLIL
ncbi:MAG: hypothetical protein MPW17_16200 [Candidatus Manganitrophus sp.]|nr:hypothetical protein [Candidatus Manganitrophus sp.]WDT70289.1 MAG: hypothetical protein MPW17_16200 [Candidatus Manganitrophus sp.]